METLANAIKLAKTALGLDDDDFDSISYCPAGGTLWTIAFSLGGQVVGQSTEDGA